MEEPFLNVKKIEELEPDDDFNNETAEERETEEKPLNMSPGAVQLRKWLNKTLKIEMSDGRVLIGVFLCTDRDANVILGSCSEYLPEENIAEATSSNASTDEPRMLGLVMVPGKHIVNICIDQTEETVDGGMDQQLSSDTSIEAVM